MSTLLPPLPVVVPLAVAAVLLTISTVLPRRLVDLVAIATALSAALGCALMVAPSGRAPLVYWFGDWHSHGAQVIGIAFMVDQASAVLATLIALLFAATLVFAWGFFQAVHAHFHVIMLVFMAGMIGFCFTHDLFNLFVWFEVMSVAAFAATGFELRPAALAGALNFTVVNTVGSYVFLAGIGLLYGEVGALDFTALSDGIAARPHDPVIVAAFALLATALLVKAAQVPFQAWLGDAHAVAPSPVSVVFSGAMVAIGVFGVAKLVWQVFPAAPEVLELVRTLLLAIGVASCVLGGATALSQRHVKRMLAFSTISHVGIVLTGLALLDRDGTAGMLAYMTGHGMVKGALFMLAGFIAARCGGIDEIELRGRGRPYWPVGLVVAFGGLLLAGLPIGTMDEGFSLIDQVAARHGESWIGTLLLIGAALTGAAVLRMTGRVFAGWGPTGGEEARSPSEQEQERTVRPLPLLVGPAVLLLVLGAIDWDSSGNFATGAAGHLMRAGPGAPPAFASSTGPLLAVAAAVLIAAYELFRDHLPTVLTRALDQAGAAPFGALRLLHSGLVTDYVAWLCVGLALFSLVAAFI